MKTSLQHTKLYSIWHRTHRELGVSFDDFVENLPKYLSVAPGFFLSGKDVKYQANTVGEWNLDKFAKYEHFNDFRKVVTYNLFRLFQNYGVFSNDGARAFTHRHYSLTQGEDGKQIRGIPYKFNKTYTLERIGRRLLKRKSSSDAVVIFAISDNGLTILGEETISFNDIFALAITNAYGEKIIKRRGEILEGIEETRQEDLESYFAPHQEADSEVPVKLLTWGLVGRRTKQVCTYLLISKFLQEANNGKSSGNGVVNSDCILHVRKSLKLKPYQWNALKEQMVESGLLRYISGKLHKVGREEVSGVGGVVDRGGFLPTFREIVGGKGRETLSYYNEWLCHLNSDLFAKPKALEEYILDNTLKFIASRSAHVRESLGREGANAYVNSIAKLLRKSPATIIRAKRRCFSVKKQGFKKADTLRAYTDHTFVSEPRGGEKNENKLLRSSQEVYTQYNYTSKSSTNFNLKNNLTRQTIKDNLTTSLSKNGVEGDVITLDTLESSDSMVQSSIPQPTASLIDLCTLFASPIDKSSFSFYPISLGEAYKFASDFSRRGLVNS